MRVYIASPLYSSGNVKDNLYQVMFTGEKLIQQGHIPYIAHFNHYWHDQFPHPESYWLELDFKWIDVCDCILRLPGISKGADLEVEYANKIGIPVYYSIDELGR